MGMTIDEAIRHLDNYSSTNGSGLTTDKQHYEAKRVAISSMCKLQKIDHIADEWTESNSFDSMAKIVEVLDGNDD